MKVIFGHFRAKRCGRRLAGFVNHSWFSGSATTPASDECKDRNNKEQSSSHALTIKQKWCRAWSPLVKWALTFNQFSFDGHDAIANPAHVMLGPVFRALATFLQTLFVAEFFNEDPVVGRHSNNYEQPGFKKPDQGLQQVFRQFPHLWFLPKISSGQVADVYIDTCLTQCIGGYL